MSKDNENKNDNSNPQQGNPTVKIADKETVITPKTSTFKIPPTKRDSRKLFVGGLPGNVTDPDFRMFFEAYGIVLDSVVMIDRDSGRSRGFGFVTFEDKAVAEKLLGGSGSRSNTIVIRGKLCEVKSAEPKQVTQNGFKQRNSSNCPDENNPRDIKTSGVKGAQQKIFENSDNSNGQKGIVVGYDMQEMVPDTTSEISSSTSSATYKKTNDNHDKEKVGMNYNNTMPVWTHSSTNEPSVPAFYPDVMESYQPYNYNTTYAHDGQQNAHLHACYPHAVYYPQMTMPYQQRDMSGMAQLPYLHTHQGHFPYYPTPNTMPYPAMMPPPMMPHYIAPQHFMPNYTTAEQYIPNANTQEPITKTTDTNISDNV